jgi:hypothetical protein
MLLFMGNCTVAQSKSSRGTLAVTARVQTSAMWVQGSDGNWMLVVANAADPATTFVAGHRPEESHRGSQSKHEDVATSNSTSESKNSVSHGGL